MINSLSIAFVLAATLIGAFGALVIKKGTLKYSFKQLFFTAYFWWGVLLYAASTVFYVLALRKEQLSVIYPLVSTSYIWVTLFSVKFLKERMNLWKWIALVGIIIGVTFIGIGS